MSDTILNTPVTVDLFDDDERQLVNQIVSGASFSIARTELLSLVMDMRNLTSAEDADFAAVVDSLYAKVNNLTDGEWDDLKGLLPFPVNISADEEPFDVFPGEEE